MPFDFCEEQRLADELAAEKQLREKAEERLCALLTEVRNAANERRAEKANAIRQLVHGVDQAPSWPPPHGWQPPVNEA